MPGDDGFGETRGWDRASIGFRSSKPYRPDIASRDLLRPSQPGMLRSHYFCFACALGITFLYLFIPLFIVNIFVPLGAWLGAALLGSFLGLTVILLVFSKRETRQLRQLAKEL